MPNVKTVTDKGDKAALLILDDGSKPIWTPDRELARTLVGKPIPGDWVRKDGEYGPQAFPPKPKGQGRYRDTKEAFDAEARSRAAWQQVEEERKDRRTALMQAGQATSETLDIIEIADVFYEWLRSSPAAGPAGFPSRKASAGAASKGEGMTSPSSAGDTSLADGEAAGTEPGEGQPKPSPGFTTKPKDCSHKIGDEWAPRIMVGGQPRCSLCGTPAVKYLEAV
jgi:hypothetical protein